MHAPTGRTPSPFSSMLCKAERACCRTAPLDAIPPLLKASVKDELWENRDLALDLLGRLKLEPSVVLPVFGQALKDVDARPRRKALNLLGNLRPDAREAIPALVEALKKGDEVDERRQIIGLLGGLGPEAKDAIPTLTELLLADQKAGGKFAVKDAIVEALGKINK